MIAVDKSRVDGVEATCLGDAGTYGKEQKRTVGDIELIVLDALLPQIRLRDQSRRRVLVDTGNIDPQDL